jgi:hypothetical protein
MNQMRYAGTGAGPGSKIVASAVITVNLKHDLHFLRLYRRDERHLRLMT